MATPKKKTSRSRRDIRRHTHQPAITQFSTDESGEARISHKVSWKALKEGRLGECSYYKKRVLDKAN